MNSTIPQHAAVGAQQVARAGIATAAWLLRGVAGKRPAASARRSATPLGLMWVCPDQGGSL